MRESVLATIDSLIHLNKFLRRKSKSAYPEQAETCGKAETLFKMLNEYYNGYDQGHRYAILLELYAH